MNNKIKVKRQTEVGSKNWGVYVDEVLVEGGFFSKDAALECAMKCWEFDGEDECED